MGEATMTEDIVTAVPAHETPPPIFIFLHGLASTEADLRPLAREFERSGYEVELLPLPIHRDHIEELPLHSVNSADTWLRDHLAGYGSRPIYLLGFSTGVAIALLYASEYPVAGVVGFSTFLAPRKRLLARYLLPPVARVCPGLRLPRRPHTTTQGTRTELRLSGTLSIRARQIAIGLGRKAARALDDVSCPMLFFHSLDDSVADYAAVAAVQKSIPAGQARLISFRCLDHFMQFDIPPFALRRFILHYFGVAQAQPSPIPAPKPEDMLKVYADERRHWTLVLFQVIAGAFTIFALLLYNTLGDVVKNMPQAPYYLLSYSVVSSIYVMLSTLYFFYANRVDAYIRFQIEPLLPGVSWSSFRTNSFISGRASPSATRMAAVPLIGVPYLISIGTVAAVFWRYTDTIIKPQWEVTLPFILCLLMALIAVFSSLRHSGFPRTYLRRIPAPLSTDAATETLLHALYTSVSPGCVKVMR